MRVGVTVMLAVIGVAEVLIAVNEGTLPVPLAWSPMAVLELVHAKVAPAGMLLKLLGGIVAPAQVEILAGVSMSGKGATVMV